MSSTLSSSILCLVVLWSITPRTLGVWLGRLPSSLVHGPEPMNAVKPIGSWVKFTAVLNRTELPEPSPLSLKIEYFWITIDNNYNRNWLGKFHYNGSLVSNSYHFPIFSNATVPVRIRCLIYIWRDDNNFYTLWSKDAILIPYGEA